MSLDEVRTKLLELNGAINLLVAQIKTIDGRLQVVETVGVGVGDARSSEIGVEEQPLAGPTNEADLGAISSLPDCVKQLQIFEGNPVQYVSWIHSVESILKDYEIVRNKPIYRAILQAVRQKIRGNADTALISYNIFDESWKKIKECLSLHYADKRDLSTLEHQLNQLSQKNMKLDEFYANVNHQLSFILNRIKTESYSEETVRVLVETYRNRALDVFVRGLNGVLSRMVVIRRPNTLPEAYTACLEVQNLNFRSNTIHNPLAINTVTAPINQLSYCRPPMDQPNRFSKFGNRIYYPPRNDRAPPLGPKPLEKMEVDRSIQTRQVNYMNRPVFKKEPSSGHYKQQRLHHVYNRHNEGTLARENDYNEEENFMSDASQAFHI